MSLIWVLAILPAGILLGAGLGLLFIALFLAHDSEKWW